MVGRWRLRRDVFSKAPLHSNRLRQERGGGCRQEGGGAAHTLQAPDGGGKLQDSSLVCGLKGECHDLAWLGLARYVEIATLGVIPA